jgi:HlyD family type I secretion membrane fusion protein
MAKAGFLWERSVNGNVRAVALFGYGAVALLVGSFGYWAATAPISGAAVAPGTIAAAGRNIMIQHLEGGIVRAIRVEEGDAVRQGQELLLLDETIPKTQVSRLQKQFASFSATIVRLEAERDGSQELSLPTATVQEHSDLLHEQRKEFEARLARFHSEQEILRQRVATLEEALVGLKSQQTAVEGQRVIINDEMTRKKTLIDKGLANHTEYSQILRNDADLIGQAGSVASEIASTRTKIIEAKEQIERLTTQRVEQAVTQLAEVRVKQSDVEEQLLAARAILSRVSVRSPADGIVVSALYNSPGSVVAPGEKLIEILPTTSKLIVDARVNPRDVDTVRIGQHARVRLTALNARITPEVVATVTHVSADRLIDEATKEPYFRARLQLAEKLPAEISIHQLYPGTPAEIFIGTGDRTFLEYLVKPVMDSFSRAFTEE